MHILFFLVSFWAIIVSSLKLKKKLLNLIIAFFPAYLMIATRVRWLPDDVNYFDRWNNFNGMGFKEYFLFISSGGKFEPGFWLIEQLPSFNATTVLISTLYFITLIYVIYSLVPKKYYPLIVALVFFNPQFATSLSARRTTIAMCLFMIAVVLKCKEKRVLSIAIATSSVLFHNTAVFMLPFIFLPLNFAEKHFKLVVLGTVTVILLTLVFPEFFNDLFIDSAEGTDLEHYSKYAETSGTITLGAVLQKLFVSIIIFLVLFSYTTVPKSGGYSFMFIITLVYFILAMLNIGQARIKVYSALYAFMFVILSYQQRRNIGTQLLLILFCLYMTMGYLLWYQKLGDYGGSFSQYSSFLF